MTRSVRSSTRSHLRRLGGAPLPNALTGATLGLVTARFAASWLTRHFGGSAPRWTRRNYRGEPVSLLEGPAVAAGLLVAALGSPGLPAAARAATVMGVGVAAAAGAYDDLNETGSPKGLRGHLGLLRQGTVSTGAVKAVALTGSGWAAAQVLRPAAPAAVFADGLLIAGSANLVNLFDLRPGRALKVGLLAAAALAATGAPPALLGSIAGMAAAALPDDLAERTMLGDCGANALGTALGCAAVVGGHPGVRVGGLGLVVSLTLLSERVSFSALIAGCRPLAALDALGARPEPRGAPSPAPARGC